MKIYLLCFLLSALVGCESRQPDTASNAEPTDVVAVRGAAGPSASSANNVFTQTVTQDLAAMKKAQSVAADANQAIAARQKAVDSASQP